MSSPLKQNTTTIQELLNTINNLPEAGGGGNIQTCEVQISLPAQLFSPETLQVYFTDANMIVQTQIIEKTVRDRILTVPIGTLLMTYGGSSVDTQSGDCISVFYGMGYHV